MVFARSALVVSALAITLSSVNAHVHLSPKFAEPNQVLETAFYVPHGCNDSSTISIDITIPETIPSIIAKPIQNWTPVTTYRDSSNKSVSTITWSGGALKATDNLGFPVTITAPNVDLSSQANATFYFPVLQKCEVGFNNWTSGASDHGSGHGSSPGLPAPVLVVVKNATQAAEDAIAIKGSATSSAPGATKTDSSAASHIYTGMLPLVAAIAALSFSL